MDLGRVDYSSATLPPTYMCHNCDKHGCKLWRPYQNAGGPPLLCLDCTEERERKRLDECVGDQIGWRVPAVPTEDGSTFWGYTLVPQAGVDWWRRLPTRVGKCAT